MPFYPPVFYYYCFSAKSRPSPCAVGKKERNRSATFVPKQPKTPRFGYRIPGGSVPAAPPPHPRPLSMAPVQRCCFQMRGAAPRARTARGSAPLSPHCPGEGEAFPRGGGGAAPGGMRDAGRATLMCVHACKRANEQQQQQQQKARP